MNIFTGHEAEMEVRKSEENEPLTKNDLAFYVVKNIKIIIEDNFGKELFLTDLTDEEKIIKIKSLIKDYNF